jgi:delta-aminolevulinic acid dehydratase/porphobilinogen synthase
MNTIESHVASFPVARLRRLRMTETLRGMVRETRLGPEDFIYPLFVVPGSNVRKEVSSMPGVYQMSVDQIVRECADVHALGIPRSFSSASRRRKTKWAPARTMLTASSRRPCGP